MTMAKLSYPQLYIGDANPDGWGEDYPIYRINHIDEFRTFVGNFLRVKECVVIGLDLRRLNSRYFYPLLKLMEDSKVDLVIRMNEPVAETVLSRAFKVVKKEKVEVKSGYDLLLRGDSLLERKIRDLHD